MQVSNRKPGILLLLGVLLQFALAGKPLQEPLNWPSFRGNGANGVSEGRSLPTRWNVEKAQNVLWKTAIPGLAHSSPVVWENLVFVTTAISSLPDASFRHGLYGEGDASTDLSTHWWRVLAVEKQTGKIVWEATAQQGRPRCQRHVKATYANATPVTDGRYVVVSFGCEGVYAFTFDGKLRWQKDLGVLNVGAYDAPSYEWGPASSPIIFQDRVLVQVDTQDDSFLLALDIHTGKEIWKTMRDELPSWGTPTVYEGRTGPELITNGSNFIRGYDPTTGRELWKLGGSSKITAPTPIVWEDLIIITSGRRPERPIFAVRAGARGDITLEPGTTQNEFVRWSRSGRGSYMPTPLAYKGFLYILANHGVLDCYDVHTGRSIYRNRILHSGGGFSASPVAGDGKLYLSSEDGDVFVLGAGGEFRLLATNAMGELLMATPAISAGVLYIRGQHHLFAIGRQSSGSSK
jgi:outer membrane protein assembly factor BamB